MRTIDLNRCLLRYAQGNCDACEAICRREPFISM